MDSFEVALPRERSCATLARRLIERRYGHDLASNVLDDLKLVVTELVANAFVHGEGQIRLKVQRDDGRVMAEVMDEGNDAAIRIRQAGIRGGGNGLRLVDHLCSAWGAYDGSTHVWAELPIAQPNIASKSADPRLGQPE
jgi:anti-sigma regulatory factor (Ser/Thr protein kinase)